MLTPSDVAPTSSTCSTGARGGRQRLPRGQLLQEMKSMTDYPRRRDCRWYLSRHPRQPPGELLPLPGAAGVCVAAGWRSRDRLGDAGLTRPPIAVVTFISKMTAADPARCPDPSPRRRNISRPSRPIARRLKQRSTSTSRMRLRWNEIRLIITCWNWTRSPLMTRCSASSRVWTVTPDRSASGAVRTSTSLMASWASNGARLGSSLVTRARRRPTTSAARLTASTAPRRGLNACAP